MKTEIIKNPAELQVIENPTKNKKTTTMAKDKTEQALGEFKNQAQTAAYILGGQAIGAQLNALVVPSFLSSQNATIQQVAKAGIPASLGVALTMFTKNKHIRGFALGMGVQGVLELIKLAMPDWTPQQGFADSSNFVFTDEAGQLQKAKFTPEGEIVDGNGIPLQLNAPAEEKTSKLSSDMDFEDDGLSDAWDSDYANDDNIEWV